jgi:hypothetical protein
MKRLLILLTWLLFSWTAKGQIDYLKYPTYDEVVSKFFDKYSIIKFLGSAEVNFEKRPTGWHVTVINYLDDSKKIKDELFWNREKKKFQKIDFEKIKIGGENEEQIEKSKKDWSNGQYSICPYYGYIGWEWDVINDFKDVKDLPDSTLYALGRAYSSYASNLLNNNSGFADSKLQFDLPQGKNCMTSEQLEKYRYYRHLAIEKYKKLTELNPKFETIVGAIGMKVSNEYLTSFLDMRIYQNEQEANKEIIEGLYSDFYIAAAKNYLNSCPPNAILITNGDNDTYPLLYVQSKFGFRTDVLVVNASLLQTDRYINSLREQILTAPGLPISLTPEEISGEKREVILIENDVENTLELNELMEFVRNEDYKKLNGSKYYSYVPSNKFRLKQGENFLEWKVDKRYFLRNQLIILDLLATNKWERPVYFAITLYSECYVGLDDYLKLEGSAYSLNSTKKDSTDDQLGSVNSFVLFSNLMTKFDWSSINKIATHEKLVCDNYRSNFYNLAEALIKENKPDSARLVLDKCIEIMPNEIVYYDFFMIPIIRSYYKIEEFEKANKIAKALANNMQENTDNHNNISIATRIEQRNVVIKNLKELATKYNQPEILKLLEK